MEMLTKLFRYEWVTFPLLGLAVFFAVYFWADKILVKLLDKSIGKKSQVMLHMKMLGMQVDEGKVTRLLLMSSFGVGFLFFMMAWPSFSVGSVLKISFGILGFQLPPIIFKSMYEKRCNLFVDQMVEP